MIVIILIGILTTVIECTSDKESLRLSCRSHGFDVDTLLCGTCSRLRDITTTTVGNYCMKCCSSPYDRAILHVSQSSAMRSSGISDFLNNRQKTFGKQVEFKMIAQHEELADLILKKDGKSIKTLPVSQWSSNDLDDFLSQYFPKAS